MMGIVPMLRAPTHGSIILGQPPEHDDTNTVLPSLDEDQSLQSWKLTQPPNFKPAKTVVKKAWRRGQRHLRSFAVRPFARRACLYGRSRH